MTTETINALMLREIRQQWQMTRAEFAALLCVSPDTYKGWEYDRPIPTQVAAHIRSISNLRLIYQHWDKIAQGIASLGCGALTGESLIAQINQADSLADDHEKLWGELFPQLKRETTDN